MENFSVIATMIDVYKIYKEDELETVALRGISFNISEGEIVAVVGPSGSGKSTLLGILGGMIEPTSGEIYWSICNNAISKLSPEDVVKHRRRYAGFIFQENSLLNGFTALQNVELAAKIADLRDFKEKAVDILDKIGLADRMKFYPNMLSSGERKRVEIANSLIVNPKIILADEPTGNLDYSTTEDILRLFTELNRELGMSFFIVTHSQQVASIADKVYEIRDGMLVGSHADNVDLARLDKSRMVKIDKFGRLTIPPHLLARIGNPESFCARINKGRIVLTPKTSDTKKHKKTIICRLCGEKVEDKSTICPNCGITLDKSCNPK